MSVVLSDFLTIWVSRTYRIPFPHVSLLRAYTNDAWLVRTSTRHYVLKVYAPGWRTDEAIRWEMAMVAHLGHSGVLTPQPVPGPDGQSLQRVALDGVLRQAVLYPFAEGEKPSPPFPLELYRREGRSVGRLHTALDSFRPPHRRPPLDLESLVWKPLAGIRSLLPGHPAVPSLVASAETIDARLRSLIESGLDVGPCHGDVTFDNVHITAEGGFIWYDFDSGGPGWRAIDLQGWAAHHPDYGLRFDSFIAGYREERSLSASDVAAAPYAHLAQEIWGMHVALYRHIAPGGIEAMEDHFQRETERIASRVRQLEMDPVEPAAGE